MNGYIDLWVRIDYSVLLEYIDVIRNMGYHAICVEGLDKRITRVKGVWVIRRKTIAGSSEKDVKEKLRGIKQEYPVVVVKPLGIQAARLAARDNRVDAILLDRDSLYYIDKTQATMMKRHSKPLEVPVNTLFSVGDRVRAMMYRRIHLFYQYNVPVIYSSSATSWNEILHPKAIVSIVKTLAGVNGKSVLLSITDYPRALLLRNGVRV